jgi:hypothetical protein
MILFLVLIGINMSALGDTGFDPSHTPHILFENTPSGMAIALALKSRIEKGVKIYFIRLYLRNTTKSDIYYSPHPANIRIEICYINDNGTQVPLRHYQYPMTAYSNAFYPIPPGYTFSRDIILGPNELKIIQSHSIICSCIVFGSGSTLTKVISSPKLLKETP